MTRYKNAFTLYNPIKQSQKKQKTANTNLDDNSNLEHNLKRPQRNSNDPKRPQKIELVKPTSALYSIKKKKSKLKGGSLHEIDEINEENLVEIFQKKTIKRN